MSDKLEWPGSDEVVLRGDAYGPADGFPVLLLHGGGQTRHAWGQTAEVLAERGFRAVALDQRGHGASDWSKSGRYDLDDYAADLSAILPRFTRPPALVGASLGGLAALIAQLDGPLGSALVLVDVAHRLEPEGVSRVLAFMQARAVEGFATLEEAAQAIAAYLPHRQPPKDLTGLSKNLLLGADGRYRWHWDPRFIRPDRAGDPARAGQRLHDAARAIKLPTLLVRGRLSDVLGEEAAREFVTLAPHTEYVDVEKAAHMVAGDRNDLFTGAIVGFLERVRTG